MSRRVSKKANYTDAQKAAYYKKKLSSSKRTYSSRPKRDYRKRDAPWLQPLLATSGGVVGGLLGGTAGGMSTMGLAAGPAATAGTALGTMAGGALGAAITHFTGLGDYRVSKNAFLQRGAFNPMPPIVNKNKHGGTVFRRSEYIGDVISAPTANTFKLDSYSINPGVENSFLWLSQIAGNYEQYVIEGCYYEYRTMSADALNSTNTALGQVIMATSYNAANPLFTNKQEMENYEGGISVKPSQSCRFFVECARRSNVLDDLYVRTSDPPAGQDIRLYDLGNFQIATNGLQGTNVNCGELWVTYQFCLLKPKMYNGLGSFDTFVSYTKNTDGVITAYGSTNLIPRASEVPIAITGAGTNSNINNMFPGNGQIVFPKIGIPQTYYIVIYWQGAAGALVSIPAVTPVACATSIAPITKFSPTAGTSTLFMMSFM